MGKNLDSVKAWRCPCGSEFWRNPTPMERIGGAESVCELCGGQSRDRPMTAPRTQLSVALAVAQELRERVGELEAEAAWDDCAPTGTRSVRRSPKPLSRP
jgi:hypothetical protein